jgi:hypothetical protein
MPLGSLRYSSRGKPAPTVWERACPAMFDKRPDHSHDQNKNKDVTCKKLKVSSAG